MNLFLIVSPFQVLNSLEAIHYFGFIDNHLWIIDTGLFPRSQFESHIDPDRWASVKFISFRYRLLGRDFGAHPPVSVKERLLELWQQVLDPALKCLKMNLIAKQTGTINHLFLGNYRRNTLSGRYMRHLANRLCHEHLYLLDVGADTLLVAHDRELDRTSEQPLCGAPQRSFAKRIKHDLYQVLVPLDTRGAPVLTFFTNYDLVSSGEDRVVRNEYAYLKSLIASVVPSDKVYFVGQPLWDQGYVTRETFVSCLRQVNAAFSGQRFIYVPHPRESAAQMEIIKELGLEVQRFATIFEHAVAFSGERPKCVATFFSSALENCASIFGQTVALKAFCIPDSVMQKNREEQAIFYSNFGSNRKAQIEIIDLGSSQESVQD